MAGVHCLIGLGEAFITTAVLAVVLQARPDLVYSFKGPLLSGRRIAEEAA